MDSHLNFEPGTAIGGRINEDSSPVDPDYVTAREGIVVKAVAVSKTRHAKERRVNRVHVGHKVE